MLQRGSGLDITDTGTQNFTIISIFSGVLSDTLHLKILWVTTPQKICTQNGNSPVKCGFTKVGDLISQDFQQTPDPDPDPDPDPNPVPLPGTLGLLGLGLLTMSQRRRRKH